MRLVPLSTRAEILVSALERQVSSHDAYGDVIHHHCTLALPHPQ